MAENIPKIDEHPLIGQKKVFEGDEGTLVFDFYPVPANDCRTIMTYDVKTHGFLRVKHEDFILVQEEIDVEKWHIFNLFVWVPWKEEDSDYFFHPLGIPSSFINEFGRVCMGNTGKLLLSHSPLNVFWQTTFETRGYPFEHLKENKITEWTGYEHVYFSHKSFIKSRLFRIFKRPDVLFPEYFPVQVKEKEIFAPPVR